MATVVLPFIIYVLGQSYDSSKNEREMSLRYIEVAVGILKEQPTDETKNLRKWAIEIIENYSTVVPLSEEALSELNSYSILFKHEEFSESETLQLS